MLEDETLIDQRKKRGLTAILEHISGLRPRWTGDCLWARACMLNGKFSVVREDMHNLFEGAEIPETQKWCLDLVVSYVVSADSARIFTGVGSSIGPGDSRTLTRCVTLSFPCQKSYYLSCYFATFVSRPSTIVCLPRHQTPIHHRRLSLSVHFSPEIRFHPPI